MKLLHNKTQGKCLQSNSHIIKHKVNVYGETLI